ncbi:hypothetical protein Tco_0712309 [Tanacetum coccineum]
MKVLRPFSKTQAAKRNDEAKRNVLRQNATNEAKRSVLRQNATNEAKRSVLRQNATNEAKRNVLRQNATNEAKRNVLRQNATNEAKRSVLRQNATNEAKRNVLRQNATNEAKRSVLRQNATNEAKRNANTFVDFRTELVEGTEREESSKRDETIGQEISSKRVGDELEQEKAKNQKIDDDQEEAKLKELMEVISDEEGVAIDDIPLSTKPLSIVDYKIIKEGKIIIYQIIRADGSLKRHGYTRPKEGYKRVLWGDLKTMFGHHVEDQCGVLLVQSYNCLFRVNAAGTKLQLLKGYNCSRIKTAEKIKIDWRSRILT